MCKATKLAFVLLFTLFGQNLCAQNLIFGRVIDNETNEGVSFCQIKLKQKRVATNADFEGNFTIKRDSFADTLLISFFGYDSLFIYLNPLTEDDSIAPKALKIYLSPRAREIKAVVIKGNSENPAFRIMRNLIANKDKNNGYNLDAFQHKSYSKIEIDIDKMSEKFQQRKAVAKILDELDSNSRLRSDEGNILLPVFFSETKSQVFFNKNPNLIRENILRTKISGLGITDGSFTSQLVGSYFQSYNIYDNWLNIAYRDFVSPISDHWKTYYDLTLLEFFDKVDGKSCYKLSFTPKRAQDLAFKGTMWITHDEYALKRIDLKIGKEANLNFIEKVSITQEYVQVIDSGAWLANKTRVILDVEEIGNNPGLLAKSYLNCTEFVVNNIKPLAFFNTKIVLDENALDKDPTYWQKNRTDSLTSEELRIYGMIDTIKNIPVIKTYTEIVNLFISGYKTIGKIDIGPPLNLYAYNNVEQHRFSLGFKTNYKFSKKLFFKANLAYGTLDKEFKYLVNTEILVAKKSYTKLGIKAAKDIEQIGLYSPLANTNYLFSATNRIGNLRQPFMLTSQFVYIESDVLKGVRQTMQLSHRNLDFLYPFRYYENLSAQGNLDSNINATELTIGYRFGFKESYLINDFDRVTIGIDGKPVIKVYGIFGFKDFLGGNFNYQKFNIDFTHSFRLGIIGRTNYAIKGGYTASVLPYPLLENHLGSRTFIYNSSSFNMMRIFEFVSDKYVNLTFYHEFDGFIENRIPLIKKLKWRFFATSQLLYGGISDKNKIIIPGLDENGRTLATFSGFKNYPYAEVGYGVSNIFKFIRVDFIHRLNYLQNGANNFGVLFSVQFSL